MTVWKAIQAGDYSALLGAVRELPNWTAETADAVHLALVAWSERALGAPVRAGDQSCSALFDLMGRLRLAHGEASLDSARPGTVAAWRAFEELLDERASKASRGDSQREAVMKRRHVPEIISALRDVDSLTQQELRMRLGVTESMLSQVLTRMEAALLVVRERDAADGRTRRVRLSDAERQGSTEPRPAGATDPQSEGQRPHRGLELAFGRKSA